MNLEEMSLHELQLLAQKLEYEVKLNKYRNNPLFWLSDRLGEDPEKFVWSLIGNYDKHIWDGDEDPLLNAWLNIAKWENTAVMSSTGIGKTYTLSRIITWFLDVYENSLVVLVGTTSFQLRDNIWSEIGNVFPKFKKLRPQSRLLNNKLVVAEENDEDDSRTWGCVQRTSGVQKSFYKRQRVNTPKEEFRCGANALTVRSVSLTLPIKK